MQKLINSRSDNLKFLLRNLFFLSAIGSLFQAAALNTTKFSIPVPVICVMIFFLLSWLRKPDLMLSQRLSKFEVSYLKYFFPFLIYGVGSALFFPVIFAGLPVFVPKLGLQYAPTGDLELTFGNIAQTLYLIFNFLYVVAALRMLRDQHGANLALYTFKVLGFVALSFTFYQFLSFEFHLYYPTDLINSNTSFDEGFDQTTSFGFRLSGVFTEPSLNGNFLGSYFVFFLIRSVWSDRLLDAFYAAIFMLATLLVTSSLGYIEIVFGVLAFIVLTVGRVFRERRIKYVSLIFVFLFVLLTYVFSTAFQNDIVYEIFDKSSSASYLQRSGSDDFAYLLFLKTWGLGVGLGSNRPSGLISYLISNVGFIGTLLFVSLILTILRPIQVLKVGTADQRAYLFGFFAFFIGKCFGVPDISYQYFWLFLIVGGVQAIAIISGPRPHPKVLGAEVIRYTAESNLKFFRS